MFDFIKKKKFDPSKVAHMHIFGQSANKRCIFCNYIILDQFDGYTEMKSKCHVCASCFGILVLEFAATGKIPPHATIGEVFQYVIDSPEDIKNMQFIRDCRNEIPKKREKAREFFLKEGDK